MSGCRPYWAECESRQQKYDNRLEGSNVPAHSACSFFGQKQLINIAKLR
jgi:hypothetical protein